MREVIHKCDICEKVMDESMGLKSLKRGRLYRALKAFPKIEISITIHSDDYQDIICDDCYPKIIEIFDAISVKI